MVDGYIILLEENEWYVKVLTLNHIYQQFDGEFFTQRGGGREGINPDYDLYDRHQFENKFKDMLIIGRRGSISQYPTSEYYRLSARDDDTSPNDGYISGHKIATSASLMLKKKSIDALVEDMAKTFQNRPNKKTNSTKYVTTFVDYKTYSSKFVIRSAINDILRDQHKLKFNGSAVEILVKKPKQKEQTDVDIKREKLFYKLFDEGNVGSVDLTALAMKTLVEAIALTIDIPYDKFDTAAIKRTILSSCYNEVLYAKMCGANDLCESMNDYRYSPSNYVKIGRYAITKRTFVDNCKNENSDKIFDELIKQVKAVCGSKPTHVANLTKNIAGVFKKFNTEKKVEDDNQTDHSNP